MTAPARPSPRRDRRGFTIVELLLALMAVSAIAGLAIPMYFERAGVSLESAALRLAEDLRAAQNRAAYLGRQVCVEFDGDGRGYTTVELLPGGERETQRRRYDADGVFEGVWIRAVDFGGDVLGARFDPRGRALAGGRVELVYRGETRALVLDRGSGRMVIAGSTSGWSDDGF